MCLKYVGSYSVTEASCTRSWKSADEGLLNHFALVLVFQSEGLVDGDFFLRCHSQQLASNLSQKVA